MRTYKHNLSHYNLATCDLGQLIPISCVPVLPGDTIQQESSAILRVTPMIAPVMHPVTVRIHHFFVPARRLWNRKTNDNNGKFEDFITGGADGNNAEEPPKITTTGTPFDLLDYLGIPLVAGIEINAMPIRAVNEIFNHWYRDQDLVTERDLDDLTIPRIAWEKDQFSSARPWTQKGAAVTIPLGTEAPVKGIGVENQTWLGAQAVYESDGTNPTYAGHKNASDNVANNRVHIEKDPTTNYPYIRADLAAAVGADINEVRRAFALQRFQEARARYGSRYTEYLRHLGVVAADSRLQDPEFLGGGSTNINFSEVLQTGSNTVTGAPGLGDGIGAMAGHGIAALRSNKYRRHMEEHGYVVTMMSVRPKALYTDGIDREFLKTAKEDYFQKELELIGQQEVFKNEVYADAASGMQTFGYQDRYHEYRHHRSRVTSMFRSTFDYWHLGRKLSSMPTLNASFVTCTPSKRVFADQALHSLFVLGLNRIAARRLVMRNPGARVI